MRVNGAVRESDFNTCYQYGKLMGALHASESYVVCCKVTKPFANVSTSGIHADLQWVETTNSVVQLT